MNKRKGFFRFTLVLSLLCGTLTLYFQVSKEIKNEYGDVFRDKKINIPLPDDWKNKSVQEKLGALDDDLIFGALVLNGAPVENPAFGTAPVEVDSSPEAQENYEKDVEAQYESYRKKVAEDFFSDLSPKEKQNLKEKLKEAIASDGERQDYLVSLGPRWTKISLFILKAFIIGFLPVWLIYAFIRWVVMGFIARGFKGKSTP